MPIEHKNIFTYQLKKRRNAVFLLFVIGTAMFWFLNKLSKDYTQVVPYQVLYEGVPNSYVFQEKPLTTLSIRVKADGFYFFFNTFKTNQIKISLANIVKKDTFTFVLPNSELKKQVRLYFKEHLHLVEIIEENIAVKLGKRAFKKVPVVPNISLQYRLGYSSFSGIHLEPDSILISGPEMQVATIQQLGLVPFVKKEVMASVRETLAIVKPNVPKITYQQETVKVNVEVEKITEKTMTVPVEIINAPAENVVLYPKKINLTCQVRLSQFNEISAKDFKVICNYQTRGSKHMELEVAFQPKVVSSVKLNTYKVEYLILK